MQMDKKWAIRLAWMIGGMCAGVLMAQNDETLTDMMQVCPECDCQEAEQEPTEATEATEATQEPTEATEAAQEPTEATEEPTETVGE